MKLEDRVAVITGASSGIGAAIAENLSAAGMKLVLTSRREDRLIELANRLRGEVEIMATDVAAPDSPSKLLERSRDVFGRADVLVNNAGLLASGPLDAIDLDALSRMIRVNYEAVVRMSYVFAQSFKAQRSGSIINISSIAAFGARPTAGVYAGVKAAVETFSSALRVELGQYGVKVSCIAPGSTSTDMLRSLRSNVGIPVDAPSIEAADIANTVRFILEQPAHSNIAGIKIYSTEEKQ